MNQRGVSAFRLVFWIVFLAAAGVAGRHFWIKNNPLENNPLWIPVKVNYYLHQTGHPNARVATDAWLQVWNLYFTKWQAYHMILERIGDPRPISFLLERKRMPGMEGGPEVDAFFADGKPIYHKADRVYARTVGDALLALPYREHKWKSDVGEDWQAWWAENKICYGK